jgi:uncharacterized protein YdeI (YjbR/CyaY-like superfamily)
MAIDSNNTKNIFFKTQADFRKWLEKNHDKKTEIWVGYYKTSSGKKSITWPQSVDEALCFGWIDGLRKSIDEESYKIRFTPRKKTSIWSNVNLKRVPELIAAGLMKDAGLKIYSERKAGSSNLYSFESKTIKLSPAYEKIFRKNTKAWKWFEASAPSYKQAAIWWVMRAKQEATQLKRLETLIKESEEELRIPHMRKWSGKEK